MTALRHRSTRLVAATALGVVVYVQFCLSAHGNPLPDIINEFTVTPTTVEYELRLSWTTPVDPERPPVRSPVQRYVIRYATYSIASLSDGTTASFTNAINLWWNATREMSISYPRVLRERESFVPPVRFHPGVTYYFAIAATDDPLHRVGSPVDAGALQPGMQAHAAPVDYPPAPVQHITTSHTIVESTTVVFVRWHDQTPEEKTSDFLCWKVYRSARHGSAPGYHRVYLGSTTVPWFVDIIGVSERTGVFTYWVSGLDAGPNFLESECPFPARLELDVEPPTIPRSLMARAADSTVRLSWSPSPEPDTAGYMVYRATMPRVDALTPLTPLPVAATTYTDRNMRNGIRYYYAVTAVDGHGNESAFSETVTGLPRDEIPPARVSGIAGYYDRDTGRTVIRWDPVSLNVDDTPCTDLARYLILQSNSVNGSFRVIGDTLPEDPHTWSERAPRFSHFYTVLAEDTSGNRSDGGLVVGPVTARSTASATTSPTARSQRTGTTAIRRPPPTDDPSDAWTRGLAEFAAGNYESAIALLQRVPRNSPHYRDAQETLVRVREKKLLADQTEAERHYSIGLQYYYDGDLANAALHLETAFALNPDHPRIREMRELMAELQQR